MNATHTDVSIAWMSALVSQVTDRAPVAADLRQRLRLLRLIAIAAAVLLSPTVSKATPFTSGSTGSYGPMNITTNTTLDMPADGIFHCTTITVNPEVTLRFNKNPLNTPVYLLATGDVVIRGTIDVSGGSPNGGTPGIGGPGGFDGGFGGSGIANNRGGDGTGPGGGKHYYDGFNYVSSSVPGAFSKEATLNGGVYGNILLIPLIGGSGASGADGNPAAGGAGGGGAILVASTTKVELNGVLVARGGYGPSGGSGGAIRLLAPVVTGGGSIDASGGLPWQSYPGSYGRIRIDCLDRFAFRSLSMAGYATRGTQMIVFPPVIPRLDITQAAGTTITLNTNGPVSISLAAGANPTNTVTIRAQDFTNAVPIRVTLTPENGASTAYDFTLNMTDNPAQTNVTVVFPIGVPTRVHAWTRQAP